MRNLLLWIGLAASSCVGDHASPGGDVDEDVCDSAEGSADCEGTIACVDACSAGDETCEDDCLRTATSSACDDARGVLTCRDEGGPVCACP